jgi:hypothetical protein
MVRNLLKTSIVISNLKDDNLLDEGFIESDNMDQVDRLNSVENININIDNDHNILEDKLIDENIPMEDATDKNIKNEYLIKLSKKESDAHLKEKVSFKKKSYKEIKENITNLYNQIKEIKIYDDKKKKRKLHK